MTPNDPHTDDLTGVMLPVTSGAAEDVTDVVAPVRRGPRERTTSEADGAAEPRPDAADGRTEVLSPVATQAPARRGRFGWGKLNGSSPAVVEPREDDLRFDPFEPAVLATLEAKHISAWFDHGRAKVLEDVSLTIPAGEVYAFIGPSGCGKSTFLRILNRMHEEIRGAEMSGEVMLDGWDIYDTSRKLTEARANIGMVFQRPNPFPAMSIYDNVIAGLRLTGARVSRGERDDIVERSLTSAGLWREAKDRLRSPGGGLSGGQQQRLCIARSLAIKPKVLLMDEPCSALDPHSTQVIEDTMIELQKEVTIVIVTHNMQQAQRVSSNTAFFFADTAKREPGFIVESGPTDVMFSSPQNERTQDYVGGRFG